ncbi:MAG: ATP-binding cassette domain-containing protein, partial [Myxococcales bacterium]|nr:ATP-binding cassette domain-containing protein [Myxococcales bacterium]
MAEPGVRVALLDQQVPLELEGTVDDVVRAGLHVRLTHGGEADHHVQRLCSLLELDPGHPFGSLSGGQKRRALLARALADEPDVLLLDEPTNHLDIESIEWLEGFLRRWTGSLVFVTHDRAFLQALSTRIVELDRGRLTSWDCDYPTYLQRKDDLLAAEEKEWERQDRKLAQEEAWIRQGIKARRTRNEGRVRALERLRKERSDRRTRTGDVKMDIQAAERSGRRVVEARDVMWSWEGEPLIRDFSTTILRGDKVGVVGPNGAGKTTLLHLLLSRLTPDEGSVKHGTSLEIAYFDQHRAQLDDDASVAESVAFGSDHVGTGSDRRHVLSYLQDFLFSAERARQPVRALSGGERNRLLLARMFTRPANVLVLDEPTNDLDTE